MPREKVAKSESSLAEALGGCNLNRPITVLPMQAFIGKLDQMYLPGTLALRVLTSGVVPSAD